jgi:predicted AAA+ superfamily ATPase
MTVEHDLGHHAERIDAELPHVCRQMPSSVRETLSWLGHLIDSNITLRTAETESEFAERHLGIDAASMVAVREKLGAFSARLVAKAFAADLVRHPPDVVTGLRTDESPTWERITVADGPRTVPTGLVAAFSAGTIADTPMVVSIDTQTEWKAREVVIRVPRDGAADAERYVRNLVGRARGPENYLRGRCVEVDSLGSVLQIRPVSTPKASRADVIVPDDVWNEIDLNVSALFHRREVLKDLGLGTNRGLVLHGRPGTGKSALCRVLAAELAGNATVVFCSARTVRGNLADLYEELGRLAPALVILEDLDLVIGQRHADNNASLHGFLTALDGAMSDHQDVVTVATTNDVSRLDEAAVRAARFDRIIEVPLPDTSARAAILTRYLGRLAAGVDAAPIAAITENASGADLRELVRRGVLLAGEEIDTVTLLSLVRGGAWSPRDVGLYL